MLPISYTSIQQKAFSSSIIALDQFHLLRGYSHNYLYNIPNIKLNFSFVGVHLGKVAKDRDKDKLVDKVCYEKCIRFLRGNHQVLIFVHSRNATKQLANTFIEISTVLGDNELFKPGATAKSSYLSSKNIMRSGKSAELQRLYQNGIGIHHAGMERHDRNLMEKMFSEGAIRVLICTATLAW